jgi:hypothetical protein
MLYVMQMVGGHSAENDAMARAVERAKRCVNPPAPPTPGEDPTVVVSFNIPGPAFGPDFSGIRRDEFSKRDRMVGFDVAVPASLPAGAEADFIWAAFVEAVDLTEEFLRQRKLDWPTAPLRGRLEQLRECLQVAADAPPLSLWLDTAQAAIPAPAETTLSVQLPTASAQPTRTDVERRQALEHLLDAALARDGTGHLDGGDIGSGMMGIYVSVVEPAAAQTVIDVLRETGDLEQAYVVLRHANPDVAEEDQYEVVWPENYAGPTPADDLYAGIVSRVS